MSSLFLRNVGIVMIGTALAQAIPMLILPYFTRVLSADLIGIYFIWLSAVAILASLATLSFEQAIFISRNKVELHSTLRLLVICAATICGFAWFFGYILSYWFDVTILPSVLRGLELLWVMYCFFFILSQALVNYYIYKSNFLESSILKVSIAFSIGLAQMLVVYFGFALEGLLISQVVMCGVVTLFFMKRNRVWPFSEKVLDNTLQTAKRCQRFIAYSTPAAVINTLASQLPIFFIAANFGPGLAGFYGLANKVLTVPSGFLSGSVLAVFKDEAGEEFRRNGNCLVAYKKVLKFLLLIAVPPFLILFLVVEYLFRLIFGEEWAEAGYYAQLLIPMVFVGFIASPLSYTLLLAQWQGVNLVWQICLLAMSYVAFNSFESFEHSIIFYSSGYSVFYIVYIAISYLAAKGQRCKFFSLG